MAVTLLQTNGYWFGKVVHGGTKPSQAQCPRNCKSDHPRRQSKSSLIKREHWLQIGQQKHSS